MSVGEAESQVRQVLTDIDAAKLDSASEAWLVRSLIDDDLIEDAQPVYAPSPVQVRLTAAGRAEVERGTTESEKPTPHLPVTRQTVFNNIFHGPVHDSPFVQGSHDVQVAVTSGDTADILRQFIHAYQTVLPELDPDVREAAEADLDTLTEQAGTAQPTPGRIGLLLNRLMGWATTVAASAVTSAASADTQTEVDRLGHQVLSLFS